MNRDGPLKDIKIIDCTQALSGPFGTGMLADLGADVIKIEPPSGDISRAVPPYPEDFSAPAQERPGGCDFGGFFASINRNKRSVVLDLKSPEGRDTLCEFAAKADVLVENARAGVMDKLGAGYEVLQRLNPRLVYAALRGFGDPRTGASPYVDWPSYDIVAQSMSGLVHSTGPEQSSGYPVGVSLGDIYPGVLLALGIVSAVHAARRDGKGQFIDVAMLDSLLSLNETMIVSYSYKGTDFGPKDLRHPELSPFGIFPTSDGAIAIAAPTGRHWEILCQAMKREDLIADERSRHALARLRNAAFVEGILEAWTRAQTTNEVMQLLGGKIPVGPVNRAEDIFRDEHAKARQMLVEIDLPGDNKKVQVAGQPIKFTDTPAGIYRRPPCLNEHAEELFREYDIRSSKPLLVKTPSLGGKQQT